MVNRPDKRLEGRRALITGASSGIGEATARRFAHAGAELVLLADHAEKLDLVALALQRQGTRVTTVVCDLAQAGEVEGMFARLEERGGPIDTLVNNAGIGLGATVLDTRPEDLRFLFEVNFFALQALCQQALKRMSERQYGYILNVGSAAGRFGSPGISAYSASKGAVHAYTQALRIEASGYDVRVCEVLPISVATAFFDSVRGERYRPGGVVLTADQVARSIEHAAVRRHPPAEILPYGPVGLAFVFDSLFPGLLGNLIARSYARANRKK